MKKILIKKLITKKGYYDRERLIAIIERGFLKHLICWLYRKFLKMNFSKKHEIKQIHFLEIAAQSFEPIGFFSKLKFKLKK